jgi:endo-1,4-beta-mannosidase
MVGDELLLLRTVGFNTLRLFLWNAALFDCEGRSTQPHADAFARLDAIIQAAAAQGFRLIVTLNDLPDDSIYSNPDYLQQQTRLIVERYRDEAAILAWDLRNEGDIDYGSNDALGRGKVEKAIVIDWLEQTAALVRELDSNHLITAGWLKDNEATGPYVDFLSFHHWEDSGMLRERINGLRAANKPILLEEFGYSTFRVSPEEQSRLIAEAVGVADAENLLGWLVWAAFDFPLDATCIRPACPSQDNAEHHFGLWFPDYMPKPIVQVLLER